MVHEKPEKQIFKISTFFKKEHLQCQHMLSSIFLPFNNLALLNLTLNCFYKRIDQRLFYLIIHVINGLNSITF